MQKQFAKSRFKIEIGFVCKRNTAQEKRKTSMASSLSHFLLLSHALCFYIKLSLPFFLFFWSFVYTMCCVICLLFLTNSTFNIIAIKPNFCVSNGTSPWVGWYESTGWSNLKTLWALHYKEMITRKKANYKAEWYTFVGANFGFSCCLSPSFIFFVTSKVRDAKHPSRPAIIGFVQESITAGSMHERRKILAVL